MLLVLERFVKDYGWLFTALASVATAAWLVFSYLQTAKLEYTKDFNSKQLATLFLTAETVSSLVSESDPQKWSAAEAAFWTLHLGDMVLFENPKIECAMTYFGAQLSTTTFGTRRALAPYAFTVSGELREFLTALNKNAWKIDLESLTGSIKDLVEARDANSGRLSDPVSFMSKIKSKCPDDVKPPIDVESKP